MCNFVLMYKTYIETKHENRDHLGPSEMGQAGYLLTRPHKKNISSCGLKNKVPYLDLMIGRMNNVPYIITLTIQRRRPYKIV